MNNLALDGVAQQTECQPVNQGVADSILRRDTCLGCELDPRGWGHVRGKNILLFLFLSFVLPSPREKLMMKPVKSLTLLLDVFFVVVDVQK